MAAQDHYHIEIRHPGSSAVGQYTLEGGAFWDAIYSIAEMFLKKGASIDVYTGQYQKAKNVWKFNYRGTLIRVPGGYYFGTPDGKHGHVWATLFDLGDPRVGTVIGKKRRG